MVGCWTVYTFPSITSIMSEPKKTINGPKAEYRSIIGDLSFSVCLPKVYAQNLGLDKGDYVRVIQENGKIIIEKAH